MTIDFFVLGLCFILMHEMDAIRCHEWRILPITSFMKDKTGMIIFVLLHIPLFYYVLTATTLENQSFRFGFSIFLIVHLGLHLMFLAHKKNEFKDWLSWSLILGAAVCGALYLVKHG